MKPRWKGEWHDLSFQKLVTIYVNDCIGYLTRVPYDDGCLAGMAENEDLLYDALRALKDACIRSTGKEPLGAAAN